MANNKKKRTAKKKRSTVGRPTKYNPDLNDKVTKYCMLGVTNEQLADFLDVSLASVKLWMKENPEFSAAVIAGRHEADADVAFSLNKRAKGFTYTETKKEGVADPESGKIIGHKITTVEKTVPPETGAITLWLKNRQPDKWRDKPEAGGDNEDQPIPDIIFECDSVDDG